MTPQHPLLLVAILCLVYSGAVAGQSIDYNNSARKLTLKGVDPPRLAPGASGTARWEYFWEFGDGHYATSRDPEIDYAYASTGTYNVRVTLTPFYSYEPTKIVTGRIGVRGAGKNDADDNRLGRNDYIDIFCNPAEELVPGSEVQVVLHYQIPPDADASEGYLFLYYNDADERKNQRIRFPIFTFEDDRIREEARSIRTGEISGVFGDAKKTINDLADYNQVRAYALSGLQPGREYRAFFSLGTTAALDTTFLRQRDGDQLKTTIRAVFVPKNAFVKNNRTVAAHELAMDYVRDPNRIRIREPRGFAYYHRGDPQELIYEVQFQNKGTGPARRVDIEIPWNDNLNPDSVAVIERDPSTSDGCPECSFTFDPARDNQTSCFKIDRSRLGSEGVLVFSFYNIWLHGKKEEGVNKNKYTKGSLKFRVRANKVKRDRHRTRARIVFGGRGGDEEWTRFTRKNWRHKGFGLRLGRLGEIAPEGFEFEAGNELDRLTGGLYFRNTALKTGWGWGLAVDYANFQFGSRTAASTLFVIDGGEEFPTALQLQRERVSMHVLDLQGQFNARLGGWLTAGVGGGISAPLFARGELEAAVVDNSTIYNAEIGVDPLEPAGITEDEFNQVLDLQRLYTDRETSKFGLLEKKEGELLLFNEDVSSKSLIGGVAHWYVEAGSLDEFAVGARQSFRYYPSSYKGQCIDFNHFELYLRLKLHTSK